MKFPVPGNFSVKDFDVPWDDNGADVVHYTFKWLEDNGYMRIATAELGRQSDILGVELTEKGLRVLHAKVDVLGISGKLGEFFRKACASGGETLIAESIKALLSLGSRIVL